MIAAESEILICKVSYNYYQVIKSNYITNGSSPIACWYTDAEEVNLGENGNSVLPTPGSMALFLVESQGQQYIVGGGFFLKRDVVYPDSCWNEYGIRTGYHSRDDFLNRMYSCGGDIEVPLNCYVIAGSFVLTKTNIFKIPEGFAFDLDGRSRFTVSTKEPIALYLKKETLAKCKLQMDKNGHYASWPGIYYKAALQRTFKEKDCYKTTLLALYHYKCAITGCTMIDTLSVSHLRPLFDERYMTVNNGIIMRSDLHRMFSKGIITAKYEDENTVVLKVTDKMPEVMTAEYKALNGKKLSMPDDRKDWPSAEYLKWHNEVRFENWLERGVFTLEDVEKKETKEGKKIEGRNSRSEYKHRA